MVRRRDLLGGGVGTAEGELAPTRLLLYRLKAALQTRADTVARAHLHARASVADAALQVVDLVVDPRAGREGSGDGLGIAGLRAA